MGNFTNNVGHIVTSVVIIVSVTVLAWHGTLTGAEALGVIGVIGGVSVGGSVASSSAGTLAPSSATGPASVGVYTSVPTTTATTPPVAVLPVTNPTLNANAVQ